MKTITVITNPKCHVPDYKALESRLRRYINRIFVDGKFVVCDSPSTVELTNDIRKHIENGDLIVVSPKTKQKDKS